MATGRTGFVQGEQAGKSGHLGDDGEIPEAEQGAAASRPGRVLGRVQTVHGTGPRPVGGTVDGRAATAVRPTDGRALGGVRAQVERAAQPFAGVFLRRI